MSTISITAALMKAVKVANINMLDNLPVRWPNVELAPPNTGPYLTVDLMPNAARVATLGNEGEDEHTGVLQVGLFYPAQAGNGAITAAEKYLRDFFLPGTFLEHDGQTVQIDQFEASTAVKDGSRLKCYLSIYYMARTQRALDNTIIQLLMVEYGGILTFDEAVERLTAVTQL